jgi:two-component system, OmpR family, heavy metal sensor histidine kinase CusS
MKAAGDLLSGWGTLRRAAANFSSPLNHKSIRFRLAVWYALALAAGLGLFALATWVSMRHSLLKDVDTTLLERAQSLHSFVNAEMAEKNVQLTEELEEYSRGFPQSAWFELKDDAGRVVFRSNAERPRRYRVLNQTLEVNGHQWQIEIAESLESVEKTLQQLRLLLIAFIPAVMIVASLGGLWLSRRALKPVDQITAAARSIGIANLSERLSVPQTGDELQRLSENWNEMLSRLESAVKRLSRFTADASHELRTPLAVIRTTAEIAARRSRSEESYREALVRVVVECERMTRMIEDLLFLARCDSEAAEMPMSTLDLAGVVDHVCSQLAPLAESSAIRLTYRRPPAGAPVLGNELAVRRLILVLLDNAIKYSKAGGEVNVTLCEEGDELHLEIADSGPGIPESELSRIFERFYRAPGARDTAQTGSGLGLSLAAGIAQHHQARIEVQSIPGQGSTFTVLFHCGAASHDSVLAGSEQHDRF